MEVKQQLTSCGEELSGEKETVTEQTARASALEVQLSTCEVQQSDASKQLAEFEEFTAKFRKMIDTGKLDVEFRRGQMIVKLPAAILFASGKADLSDDGRAALADVAAIFEKMPKRRFTIAGHTDSARVTNDSFTDNWDLSAARAVAVTRELVRKRVPAHNLVAAGYSKYDPIATNSSARGRERNRRIEIILEPVLREVELPTAKKPNRKSGKR
ncbi:MAG TPA: OmpA family protein [Kofleriaceae bacterium]|nr:OmpA family protein [Kofleriaceae bacterium]